MVISLIIPLFCRLSWPARLTPALRRGRQNKSKGAEKQVHIPQNTSSIRIISENFKLEIKDPRIASYYSRTKNRPETALESNKKSRVFNYYNERFRVRK